MKSYNYTDKDYDEVIEFLGELYQLDDRRPYWLPGRWEYASYLCNPLFSERGYPDWKQYIRIVRDGNSIVGLANSENPDHNAYIHTHTKYKSLENDLIAWVEEKFDFQKITIWCLDDDNRRQEVLRTRGYREEEVNDYLNWCDIGRHEPRVHLPTTFEIVSFEDGFNLDSRIECSSKAFNSKRFSKEVYHFMQKAPSYDPSLDLVIKAGDDVISLCTIWEDRKNNLAYFEPVATHPDFQGKGLGLAIVNEGIRRLRERNIPKAYVGSAGDWRKAFYCKAGFSKSVLCKPWTKR